MGNESPDSRASRGTQPAWRRMMASILFVVVVSFLGLLFLLYTFQTIIIFPATRGVTENPAVLGWEFEEVKLPVVGETTVGWYMPVPDAKGTVLFSHGNGGNMSGWMYACEVYRNLGLNVLLYDYGGYGPSTGSPSEKRCYADIRAMWDWLTVTKGIEPQSIVLVGRSLGGGVTSHLAAEVTPGAISMESTFLSTAKVAKGIFPFLPASLIVRHRFDTESRIPKFTAPILVCHGQADEVIPYWHGKALYDQVTQPKRFLEIHGGHNDGYFVSEKAYADAFREFVLPTLRKR